MTQDAILANIFLAIQGQLQAQCPELKFIDLDTGQLEYKDAQERPAILLPCALFDFTDVRFTDASDGVQVAEDSTLQIRLGIDPFTQATHYFTQTQIANAINFFNIEHRVNLALHTWCDEVNFGPLSRTNLKSERRTDKLRVRVITYKFGYMDYTAKPVPAQTITRPDVAITPPAEA